MMTTPAYYRYTRTLQLEGHHALCAELLMGSSLSTPVERATSVTEEIPVWLRHINIPGPWSNTKHAENLGPWGWHQVVSSPIPSYKMILRIRFSDAVALFLSAVKIRFSDAVALFLSAVRILLFLCNTAVQRCSPVRDPLTVCKIF